MVPWIVQEVPSFCLETLGGGIVWRGLMGLQAGRQRRCHAKSIKTHLFRLLRVISFFSAAPSNGLSSSKEHSRSSDTDMQAP